MAQDVFEDWDATSSNNLTVTGDAGAINIAEGMAPGLVNNAMRAIMSGAKLSWGGMPSGASRPASLLARRFWMNTTTATAPILTWYDGTDDIPFATIDETANTITLSASTITTSTVVADGDYGDITVSSSGTVWTVDTLDLVNDLTPQLGGNLDVNGKSIVSVPDNPVIIEPGGAGEVRLNAAVVTVEGDIVHSGDADTYISYLTNQIILAAGGQDYVDVNASGVRLGTTGSVRINQTLDEDGMGSDSATALATQQSIKAYVDASVPTTGFTLGTAVATTSGTAHDFGSIPAGVDRIDLVFAGVSTTGTSNLLVQIGDSGGVEITSYVAIADTVGAGAVASTDGFISTGANAATRIWHGAVTLVRQDGNTWVASGTISDSATAATPEAISGGTKTLSAELTTVRLTTVTGTDTFDAGSLNVMYI